MKDLQRNETKKWIKIWQKAGNSLEEIRLQELRAPDYYSKNLNLLNEMLKYAFANRKVKLDSGLVQQQQIFKYWQEVS